MEFNIINPKTKSELLGAIRRENHFRFGAGFTDLLMELRKQPEENLTIINLSQIKDAQFTDIKKSAKVYHIGALFSAHNIVMNEALRIHFPVLHEAAWNLASTQIRQVATIGGNLCTASPSGDISCALMALKAECEILGTNGKIRTVPIIDFFTGLRKTVLKPNEVLYAVTIPVNDKKTKKVFSGFIKIGTRRSMECSVVSLAYHIQIDSDGMVINAGAGIGSSAPSIRFPKTACNYIIGKNFDAISVKEKNDFAEHILSYSSPISDIRASAWYRKEVLYNISKSIFE